MDCVLGDILSLLKSSRNDTWYGLGLGSSHRYTILANMGKRNIDFSGENTWGAQCNERETTTKQAALVVEIIGVRQMSRYSSIMF